ncbi:MAG: VWA domain-containing protein, partial [Acidobacteria bacterium]|nr:VWA domain-containing protein [Acidobacteriota bacterium]
MLCQRRVLHSVAALGLALLAVPTASAVERLSLSHVRQVAGHPPEVRVYLDATDDDGEPLRGLEVSGLQATLGSEQAQVRTLEPFEKTGEGIAYIFLVDVSRSLTEEQFSGIRDALEAWILDFTPEDWGAVIAFGETSRLVVDFTSDWRELRNGLDTLGPTDNLTLFHQALDDAIELSLRRDPGMPGRRVAVVLTDGLDEGSGLTLDDVLARLREHPLPIHAIGYSRIKPEARRQEYLDVLQRLASNSGGTFFEAQQTDFAESYAAIRRAIRRVWVADVVCPTCEADGRVYRLQTNLSFGNRVLSRGTDLRLLPTAAPAAEPVATPDADGEQPVSPPPSSEAGEEEASSTVGVGAAPQRPPGGGA